MCHTQIVHVDAFIISLDFCMVSIIVIIGYPSLQRPYDKGDNICPVLGSQYVVFTVVCHIVWIKIQF